MPALALALCALWALLLFAVRSLVQWRRTGSTGIKGISGAVGSVEWTAGVVASIGLLLTPLAPLATLQGWPGGALLFESTLLHASGVVCMGVGIIGALLAQLAMGDAWRIGVDAAERTALVTAGLFAWARNPIFSFIVLSLAGIVLLVPSLWALLAFTFLVLGIELQVRWVEEPYLRTVHGEAYVRYAQRVGRFLPWFGRGLGT